MTFCCDHVTIEMFSKGERVMAAATKEHIIELLHHEMPYLQKEYHVKRLALFGSYAKGHPSDESDVDIFVEFDGFIGLKFVALGEHLESLLGKKVDQIKPGGLTTIRHSKVAEEIRKSLVYA